jgi:hypothetical protein
MDEMVLDAARQIAASRKTRVYALARDYLTRLSSTAPFSQCTLAPLCSTPKMSITGSSKAPSVSRIPSSPVS